ncbi:3' terminal RNA ribose 2'-O-methyltransferase Hen1 [Methylobacterium nonmethylotrophicum]|uniref:Small RNA 2'-O-methyltransferase n=1 Tax=Methylobacterium nonmethylotrophicum TaxID=1141884 RepID=A0A4Z0NLW5_9HYPH|nr:3' terminal RNA ribose 2'-O-methyltransferase Hen1 [Methylobacterium nonmethylotrophicum]TGD96806.1 3' terminal RNA ribose 2'-O-methyltransferase Hen1 [Methylobacterium nonmethylotrophicum]
MFLSVATAHRPATDLGFLLHKNPARMQDLDLGFGRAVMLYPEANDARCEFVLTLDIDPVALVRGRSGSEGLLDQYVNDRPYAASSFLSVAIGRCLGAAMGGRSKERPALAQTKIPLSVTVAPLPVRGRPDLVERLFSPLGYAVEVTRHPLDPERPDWGEAPYVTLRLSGTARLADLLTHLTVLMPVLDDRKHYFVGEDEIGKLLARGEGWLPDHPERDLIVARYLKRRGALVRQALAQLAEAASEPDAALDPAGQEETEAAIERPLRLHERRLDRVAQVIAESGTKGGTLRVLDLGCGDGKLIARLIRDPAIAQVVGVEVSSAELARAARRFETLPEALHRKLALLQGSLIYRDARLRGFDAAALVEVIEHVEPDRLPHLERALFGDAKPATIVVTTPNRDHNALFPGLPADRLRHPDHRFEWSRAEFAAWAGRVASDHGYAVRIEGIGDAHPDYGAPSQMAVFSR